MNLLTISIVKGLHHIHSKKITHRDLKPQNIFLTKSGIIKIGDFGLAKERLDLHETFIGTPLYMAPELTEKEYNSKVDIWSISVIFYEMLFGFPFNKTNFLTLSSDIQNKDLSKDINEELKKNPKVISNGLKDLILRGLERDPNKRISIEEMYNHSYIQNLFKNEKRTSLKPESLSDSNEENFEFVQVEEFQNYKSISSIIVDNSLNYQKDIFDFSNFKTDLPIEYIESIELNIKRSWAIAESGYLLLKTNMNLEALGLFNISLKLIYSSVEVISKIEKEFKDNMRIKSSKMYIILTIVHSFVNLMIFEISDFVETLKKKNIESKTIICEDLLLKYSTNLMKKAFSNEMINEKIVENDVIYYNRAYLILDYLYTLKINENLKNYLNNCLTYLKDEILNKN